MERQSFHIRKLGEIAVFFAMFYIKTVVFKFLWSEGCKAENGVGVIVYDRFYDGVWEVVSCYFPQVDRSVNEKEEFYELWTRLRQMRRS